MKSFIRYSILLLLVLWNSHAIAEQIGTVISLEGQAIARKADGTTRRLELRSPVFLHDTLITGADSKIQILFNDETVIYQGAEAELTLDEYVYNPDEANENSTSVNLVRGVFRVITGNITRLNPDRFRVRTRMATIGIRGCDLGFQVRGDRHNIFIVALHGYESVIVDAERGPRDRQRQRRITVTRGNRLVTALPTGELEERDFTPDELRNLLREVMPADATDATDEDTDTTLDEEESDTPADEDTDTTQDDEDTDTPTEDLNGDQVDEETQADREDSRDREDQITNGDRSTIDEAGGDDDDTVTRWIDPSSLTRDSTTDLSTNGDDDTTDQTDDGDSARTDRTDDGETDTTDQTDDGDSARTDRTDDGETDTTDSGSTGSGRTFQSKGGGSDWSWGVWETDGVVDSVQFKADQPISSSDFQAIAAGTTMHRLSGEGVAAAVIKHAGRNHYVEGSSYISVQVGQGVTPNWDGNFSMSGDSGNSLAFGVIGLIQPTGQMTGNRTSYSMSVNGNNFGGDSIQSEEIQGRLVGPGSGTTPITGAVGSFSFDHGAAQVNGGFGTNLRTED